MKLNELLFLNPKEGQKMSFVDAFFSHFSHSLRVISKAI